MKNVSIVKLTVQNLLLSISTFHLRNMARSVEQTELPAAVKALVHAEAARVDAERGRLLRDNQV